MKSIRFYRASLADSILILYLLVYRNLLILLDVIMMVQKSFKKKPSYFSDCNYPPRQTKVEILLKKQEIVLHP